MAVNIRDNRREFDKLKRRIKQGQKVNVVAGITHDAGYGAEPGGPTVAEYAIINELGLGVPSRPFMGHYYDGKRPYIVRFSKNAFKQYVMGTVPTIDIALNAIGVKVQNGIQESIRTAYQWAQPNAPATIRIKTHKAHWQSASDIGPMMPKPLIDHGIMLNSVTFEIQRGRMVPR